MQKTSIPSDIPNLRRLSRLFPQIARTTDTASVYGFLESQMRSYQDYATIATIDNGEPLVAIEAKPSLQTNQIDPAMRAITGEDILVRKTIEQKLQAAAQSLGKTSCLGLEVVYGYRDLAIQTKLFDMICSQERQNGFAGSEAELLELAHRSIAVPEVAGHPTGGAIDIQLTQDGEPLDMGTPIWAFTKDSYVFSPYISRTAWANRQLLRDIMENQGFVPFDGEWWHFSYGDKEWAVATGAPSAIYEQLKYEPLNATIGEDYGTINKPL